jgi:hypothetical protein
VQQSTDTDLAAALAVGQKRYFGTQLLIDWARDGSYSDPLSDLSAYLDDAVLDKSLAGVIPTELQVTEGYSGAKLTITLSGKLPDGTPLWKMFSPYAAYGSYGTGGAVNTPMYFKIKTVTPVGVKVTDQMVGWVDSAMPSRANGNVTITCFDAIGQLENAVTQYRWGCDSYLREVVLNIGGTASGELLEAGTGAMDWLVDDILRRSGFFQGPQWHPNVIAAWTLRGSTLPAIGAINQEYPTVYQDVWNFGNMTWATPMISPAMATPGDVWSKAAGKYGPAFKGLNSLGLWNGATRAVNYLTGSANAADRYEVATYGTSGHNLLGASAWVFVDTTQANTPISDTAFYLSAMTKDYGTSGQQYPAYARMAFVQSTGVAAWQIQQEGNGAAQHQWTTTLSNGWHFVSWVADFSSTAVLSSCWVDGVRVINNTNGGTTGSVGSFTYPWWDNTTNCVTVSCELAMQYVQWIEGRNQLLASYVQPVSTPPTDPRYQASIDLAGQRLHWLPDINQESSGAVLTAAVGADLGAMYATEQGVVTFDSRATIKSRQSSSLITFDLTLDQLEEINPETTYASVANKIGYTSTLWTAVPYSNIYAAQQANQFLIPPGTFDYPVTLTNVQSIRVGSVTYRPFAQGYDAGLSPPTLYYQNYMDYYKPAYWQDGFTGYLPGSRPSNGPPPVQSNMNCSAIPGWVTGYSDPNCRHMKVRVINGSGTASREFAVDDGTPFLNIAGTLLATRPAITESVVDATSTARYKERIYNLPTDDWHQDIKWLRTVAASLLADTKDPKTVFTAMNVPGDPRRQLQDVVRIVDPDLPGAPGMTASTVAYGSVVGISRQITREGDGAKLVDSLTIRTFPG